MLASAIARVAGLPAAFAAAAVRGPRACGEPADRALRMSARPPAITASARTATPAPWALGRITPVTASVPTT